MKIGEKVKQKNTIAQRIGTIIGIWEKDEYYYGKDGNEICFACKGEFKVKFDNDKSDGYQTFSIQQLEKL